MTGPRHIHVDPRGLSSEALKAITMHLRNGGVLVYPTETVYGMGCLVRSVALERLFDLKGRDPKQPVLLLVTQEGQAPGLRWNRPARALADAFWPGPLTLILTDPVGAYPDGVRSSEGGVAIRESPHPLVRELVHALQEPLTSTSANASGAPPARSGVEAMELAGSLSQAGDLWVLDAGPLPSSPPSTVVDCTGSTPVVRREGAIPSEDVFAALKGVS